ncbi:MAG: hypothetical protein FIA89_15900 [Geobacter sp.]|nr:hypothetical protein [Geobacter sp.]
MYGTVRTVVWEDGGSNPASYPMQQAPDEVITADGSGMYSCNKENHDSIDGGLLFSSGGA